MKELSFKNFIISLLFFSMSWNAIAAQTIEPKFKDGVYSFQIANVYFEVNPKFAGRISSLQLDNKEILYLERSNKKDIFGSTLWPSPQSFWNWPPIAVLSDNPYTGAINGNKIVMKSERDSLTGLIFEKTFFADLADTSITLIYEMKNTKNVSVKFSLWELSRVPAGGIVFFPMGDEKLSGGLSAYFKEVNNVAWYKFDKSQKGDQKLFSAGKEGWSGFVNDNILFLKTFDNVDPAKQAPGEKELEYWLTADHHFIELENQGPYCEIKPNDSVDWKIKWYVRKLPEGIKAEVCNEKLIELARQIKRKN